MATEPKPQHPFGNLPTFGETVLAQLEKSWAESDRKRAAKRLEAAEVLKGLPDGV